MVRYEIEGGFPLKGRIRASGNKNAALPASPPPCSPRTRSCCATCRASATWRSCSPSSRNWATGSRGSTTNHVRIDPRRSDSRSIPRPGRGSAPRSCSPARCWPGSGGCSCRPPAATSSAGGGWTPTSSPCEELGAEVEIDGQLRPVRPTGCAGADIFLDEAARHRHRERADGGRAGARGSTVLRNAASRAPRPGPLPAARGDGRADRRHRLQHPTRSRAATPLHGADYTIGPDYIEIGSFIGLAAVTNGELDDRGRPGRTTCA